MRVLRRDKLVLGSEGEFEIKLPAGTLDETVDEIYVNVDEVDTVTVLGKQASEFTPTKVVNLSTFSIASTIKAPGTYLVIPGSFKEIKLEGSCTGELVILGEQ